MEKKKDVLGLLDLFSDWIDDLIPTPLINIKELKYQDPIYTKKDILKKKLSKDCKGCKETHFHKKNFNIIPSDKRLRKWYNNNVCEELRK